MRKLSLLLFLLSILYIPSIYGQTVPCTPTAASGTAWSNCPLNASNQLWNAVSATGTATAIAQKVYNFSMSGDILITWAGITGSPAGCTIQVKSGDSLGNLVNNGAAIAVTPANGTTSTVFVPATNLQTADQIQTIYSCSTYPTAGTLSLEFVPSTVSQPLDANGNVNVNINAASLSGSVPGNLKQINGSTVQVAGSGIQKVGITGNAGAAVDQAPGSATPANALYVGGRGSGNITPPIVCDNWTPFSLASTTSLKLVSKAASKQVYICSINILVAGANNVALIEGTKTTTDCDTTTAGMAGGTTAATGWNFPSNGGLTQGSGIGAIAATATANHDVCLLASASTQVSGVISWTQF